VIIMNNDELLNKNIDSFRWMYCEVILQAFNNILPHDWYQYYLSRYLVKKEKYVKVKLNRHYEAIRWFMTERDEVCFKILGLEHLTNEEVFNAIMKRFNGNKKFIKILKEFQMRLEHRSDTSPEQRPNSSGDRGSHSLNSVRRENKEKPSPKATSSMPLFNRAASGDLHNMRKTRKKDGLLQVQAL